MARFVAHNYPRPYFATYWITDAVFCILSIFAVYEVLSTVFGSLPCGQWIRFIFPVILLVSIALSMAHAQAVQPQGLRYYILAGEIAVRMVQVLVFVGTVLAVPLLGLSWPRYSLGVASGFGFYATVMLLTTTRFLDLGTRFRSAFSVTSLTSYSVAMLIWIWFFARPQPEKRLPLLPRLDLFPGRRPPVDDARDARPNLRHPLAAGGLRSLLGADAPGRDA
ncbi:MAG: hypothetical protein WCA49_10300 [Candidatus Sulfotelmatobacter sp.]